MRLAAFVVVIFPLCLTGRTAVVPKTPPITIEALKAEYVGKRFVVERRLLAYKATPSPGGGGFAGSTDSVWIDPGNIVELKALENDDLEGPSSFAPNAFGETSQRSKKLFLALYFEDVQNNRFFQLTDLPKVLELSKAGDGSRNDLRLTTLPSSHAAKVPALLTGLIGKLLYADVDSEVFQADTTIEELLLRMPGKRISHINLDTYCCMQPLRILKAQYSAPNDLVLLELGLPDGRVVLTSTPYVDNDRIPPIERVSGSLYSSVPSNLSAIDLRALRHKSIVIGMSRNAVQMEYGYPEKENDYGSGGTQLIYDGGRYLVYVNSAEKVTDIQILDF